VPCGSQVDTSRSAHGSLGFCVPARSGRGRTAASARLKVVVPIAATGNGSECAKCANWPFFVAFAAFRVASILFGVRARARQGSAASSNAEEIGGLADVYAEIGWRAAREG
jgi:hypothetical protein